MARDRSAHLSRDGRLGKNWLSPRRVRRCRRNAPLPCDLRRTARSVVLQQDFYRFADWRKFAARVADRVALAGRGNDPQRYQRPLFSKKSDRVLYFLSRIVCLAEVLFVLAPLLALSQGLEHIMILGDAINPCLQASHVVGWVLMSGVVLLIIAAVRFVRLPGHG